MQVKTKNFMFAGLIVVLVGALWYRVVYSSMESKASKAKTAAHDADSKATSLRAQLNGSANSAKNTKDPAVAVMHEAVPANPSEATFLRSLDGVLTASGVSWQSVSPSLPVVAGSLTTITVGITVSGTQAQVEAFVTGLSGLSRVFIVDNLSISPGGDKAAPGGAPIPGRTGDAFAGDAVQAAVSGRIFSQASVVAPTGAAGTPTGGATTNTTVPASGATAPSGVQNN